MTSSLNMIHSGARDKNISDVVHMTIIANFNHYILCSELVNHLYLYSSVVTVSKPETKT